MVDVVRLESVASADDISEIVHSRNFYTLRTSWFPNDSSFGWLNSHNAQTDVAKLYIDDNRETSLLANCSEIFLNINLQKGKFNFDHIFQRLPGTCTIRALHIFSYSCNFAAKVCTQLNHAKSIARLEVSGDPCNKSITPHLKAICGVAKIESLRFSGGDSLPKSKILRSLMEMRNFCVHLHRLEVVFHDEQINISAFLVNVLRSCRSLRWLFVSMERAAVDDVFAVEVEVHTSLETLSLCVDEILDEDNTEDYFTDSALLTFLRCVPNLRELCIPADTSNHISLPALKHIIEAFPDIEYLETGSFCYDNAFPQERVAYYQRMTYTMPERLPLRSGAYFTLVNCSKKNLLALKELLLLLRDRLLALSLQDCEIDSGFLGWIMDNVRKLVHLQLLVDCPTFSVQSLRQVLRIDEKAYAQWKADDSLPAEVREALDRFSDDKALAFTISNEKLLSQAAAGTPRREVMYLQLMLEAGHGRAAFVREFLDVVRYCDAVDAVDLRGEPLEAELLTFMRSTGCFKELRELHHEHADAYPLSDVTSQCTGLETLCVRQCLLHKSDLFTTLQQQCTSIRTLYLSEVCLSVDCFPVIAFALCKTLRFLSLIDIELQRDHTFMHFAAQAAEEDEELIDVSAIEIILMKCSKLKVFVARNVHEFRNDEVVFLIESYGVISDSRFHI